MVGIGGQRRLADSEVSRPRDWYLPLAAHLGEAYLRYGFTFGAKQEASFLFEALGLAPGSRLLDVGCGPGRHSIEFARRGAGVVGIDLSPDFLSVARSKASQAQVSVSFFEMDAHDLVFDDEFDAVISLCEGAFGLGLDDLSILRGMARAAKPGGRLAVGAPNLFYVLRHLSGSGEFDPVRMVFKETAAVKGSDENERDFEMWNSCYTPRELEWMANGAGLDPEGVYGISPGNYARETPAFDHPELLLIARKPPARD